MVRFNRPRLERLMKYYQFICEQTCAVSPVKVIISNVFSEALEIDDTLVRKDLASIGIRGQPNVGFDAAKICRAVRRTLGFDRQFKAVLVGAGHLGGAVLGYTGFDRYGLSFVAAFDKDPKKIGTKIGDCPIRSIRVMESFIIRNHIPLAVLTVPATTAQELTNRLVLAGIRAIWNFSSTKVLSPERVFIRHEHISLGLSEIAYYLKGKE